MELGSLLIASLFIMFASLAGVLFVSKRLGNWTERNINYLIAFSAGVFLIVSYDLIFEAVEFATNISAVLVAIIVGFLAFYLFERLYPEVHCHHEDNRCLIEKSKRGARKILIGDACHNIGDGILLAPIFVVDIRLGFIAAIGIFVHEFVQEISEYFILRKAGYTMSEALVRNFIVSATILIGAIGGFYLASFEAFVGPLIGLAAGAFIYILVADLIPESVKHSHRERKYVKYIVWTLVGVLLILIVNTLSGNALEKKGLDSHGHIHTEEHGAHEENDHGHGHD